MGGGRVVANRTPLAFQFFLAVSREQLHELIHAKTLRIRHRALATRQCFRRRACLPRPRILRRTVECDRPGPWNAANPKLRTLGPSRLMAAEQCARFDPLFADREKG